MTRRYDESVDVRRRDDVPAEFLWRGRFYVVRDVLAHWIETGAWWRTGGVRATYATDATYATEGAFPEGGAAERAASAPARGGGGDTRLGVQAGLDPGERELWRVEASAGRTGGGGVYDLCFDWGVGAWTLARALD